MDEEEKKSNKKPIIIVLVYFLAIVILMGMIYSYLLEEESENSSNQYPIILEYNGQIYTNVHNIGIKSEPSEDIALQNVTITVLGEVNGTFITITNDTLLSDAKNYSLYAFPYTFISYFDNDSDDHLTSGDFITITIEPSNPGNYTVKLIHNYDKTLAILIFEIK